MRELHTDNIIQTVKQLCVRANMQLPEDLEQVIHHCAKQEPFEIARGVLQDICDNLTCAKQIGVPICQDTGMTVVFLEVGQDLHIVGRSLTDAVNQGVREGYLEGNLRCSIVADPLERINTGDNTPAIVHMSMVPGEQLGITVAPKGFGSENMSALKMFAPSATKQEIIDYIVSQVEQAGSHPCPPIVVGVGIGGDFEYCAYLAKKAVCRPVSNRHHKPLYAQMEQQLLHKINATGIGPQGFGGKTTALCVNIETHPTHIAGLPVAINIGCHVTRHATAYL